MEFLITTTGTQDPLVFNDLGGRHFDHPTVDFDLLTEFAPEEISASLDVQAAIDSGYMTVKDEAGNSLDNAKTITNIDGDQLNIDWNPSNYTPDDGISEADNVDDLAAHLKGIDNKFAAIAHSATTGQTTDDHHAKVHAADHISGTDEVDGDKLDIDFTPSNYTPAATPAEADDADDLAAHLYGIDQKFAAIAHSATTGQTTDDHHAKVHAADHISGTDEVDGDKLDIDFTPSNYTPATTPAEADDVDDLAAHLYGIDVKMAAVGLAFPLMDGTNPYIENSVESYTAYAHFIFPGTSVYTPSTWKIVASRAGTTNGCNYQLYDISNSLEVANIAKTTSGIELLTDSSLSNLPSSPAIFAVRMQNDAGGSNARIHASSLF